MLIKKIKKYKKEIENYKKEILLREEKIEKAEAEIFNYIDSIIKKTNFFITIDDKIKTYYYFSSYATKNPLSFYGIKIKNDNSFEIGKILIDFRNISLMESIESSTFFNKSLFTKINFQYNDLTKECFSYKGEYKKINNRNSVAYCRKSKKNDKDYKTQEENIKNKAIQNDCEIEYFFNETISGVTPFEDRKAIKEMIEYCYLNNIDTIYVSEFTRLGRKEKIIIDGIRFLRKNGINKIYIVSENIVIDDDSLKNNYKKIIELAKASEKEREYITNRLSTGRNQYILKCREEGIKMGRPSTYKKSDDAYLTQYIEDIKLIKEKKSLRQINAITGTSIMTIRKIKEILKRNNILN